MKRLPPLIALCYFEVAARTGSFAAAAKELHVTPAAISHQIRALETHLGVALFVRHHRRVSLTPAARAVLPRLQEGFAALADAADRLRAYGEEEGLITICAEPLFATKWVVPRLHRFYARCPEAEVRLQASVNSVDRRRDEPVEPATFLRAGIDLAVRLGHGDYPGLAAERLLEVHLVPVCAPGPDRRLPLDSQALAAMTLLSDGAAQRAQGAAGWAEWFRLADLEPPEALRERRFGNGLLALEAALSGQGALLAARPLVQAELDAGKLVVAHETALHGPLAYHVVSPPASLERPVVQAFRDWLREEAAGQGVTLDPERVAQ